MPDGKNTEIPQEHRADAIKQIPPADLEPYPNNSRTHSDEQIGQIVASIREFGFTNPILTHPDVGVVAGHARLMAAIMLGLDTVPTIDLRHLTPEQARAYVIADNQLPQNAGWNPEVLATELEALREVDFDLGLLGFDDFQLSTLLGDGLQMGSLSDLSDHGERDVEQITLTVPVGVGDDLREKLASIAAGMELDDEEPAPLGHALRHVIDGHFARRQ